MAKTLRLVSWNVNGIRAAERKGFLDWMHKERFDIVGIQETKAHVEQLSTNLIHPEGYESYWNSSDVKKGYSGVCAYTRISPIFAMSHFGHQKMDEEGRVVLLEFEKFYFFTVYFPNGKRDATRLKYKMDFYEEFLEIMEAYRKKKPVVMCGDVNTAHTELDLARPKANEKTSGFLPMERAWLDKLGAHGYVDTFRMFEQGPGHYSWWDQLTRARERDVGWRIDYFWVSEELKPHVKRAWIAKDVHGSDHAPVCLELTF